MQKNILRICLAVGLSAALAACGGGSSSPDAGVFIGADAATSDGGQTAACNPVAQTGCSPTEKCGHLVENEEPYLARTACVPAGDIAIGETCVEGDPGATTGYDDCVGGAHCLRGTCVEICGQAPNTCESGNCVAYSALFNDLENTGLCAASCDPVVQDCTVETEACYLSTGNGTSSCARVPEEASMLTQDDDCYGPDSDSCFLNGCAEGFGSNLNKGGPDGPGGSVCAAFCSPVIQHTGDSNSLGGDPSGVTCASRGAVSHHCRFINSFYSNTEMVPDSVGFCVPPDLWDSCANHTLGSQDPETFVPGCEPRAASMANIAPSTLPVMNGDLDNLPRR